MGLEKKIEDYLAQLRGSGPLSEEKNEVDIAKNVDVDNSSGTAKNYDQGGAVEPSWQDKLGTVMQKMGQSPIGQVAGALFDPIGTGVDAAAAALPKIASAEGPLLQRNASALTGGAVPPPAMSANASPTPMPQPQASIAQAAPSPKPQAAPTARPPAQDLLAKLTDNDSGKLQDLLSQLKDSDRRGAFAQALGVIGDTLGNVGNAKAGMTPQGFTGTDLITKQNDANRGKLQDNVKMELMSNPNSQTSRMAQIALLQAMNIPQNDPRAASIMKMPAQSIISTMPQLQDSIKIQLERESHTLQQKQLESSIKDREAQLQIAGAAQQTQQAKDRGDLAANVAEHTSIFNPQHYQAQNAALQGAGIGQPSAPHGAPELGSTFNGHKITKVTRIK